MDRLIQKGAVVTVVDNLSMLNARHIYRVLTEHGLTVRGDMLESEAWAGPHRLLLRDLANPKHAAEAVSGQEVVFHLAATVGGRGFIDTHPADCCASLAINQNVVHQSCLAGVRHVHYASTACVYPLDLQATYGSATLLTEGDAFKNGWANCDREYGWAKFMGEVILLAYLKQYGLEGSVCRYVTAYGPWENDTHAVVALIKKAAKRQDPYVIWGTGEQDRDFTYVDDIVEGSIRAAEAISDGSAVNLGTAVRHKLKDVAQMIFELVGWKPSEILFDATKPEGVASRALDISRAQGCWRGHRGSLCAKVCSGRSSGMCRPAPSRLKPLSNATVLKVFAQGVGSLSCVYKRVKTHGKQCKERISHLSTSIWTRI